MEKQNSGAMSQNRHPACDRYPEVLRGEDNYKQCIQEINSTNKYTQFMEEQLLLQSIHLTNKELWDLIQKVTGDVLKTHPDTINPLDLQRWIVTLDQALHDTKPADNLQKVKKNKSFTNSTSSRSSTIPYGEEDQREDSDFTTTTNTSITTYNSTLSSNTSLSEFSHTPTPSSSSITTSSMSSFTKSSLADSEDDIGDTDSEQGGESDTPNSGEQTLSQPQSQGTQQNEQNEEEED